MTTATKPGPNPGPKPEGRVQRRQKRNRRALIDAARHIMSDKGVDATTMLEVAEQADVAAGTVYNYFKSKEDLAFAVLEELMHDLAIRIEKVTQTFDDPAQVYAFGIRNVIDTATGDMRWQQLLNHSEVIAEAMFIQMGPFAIRDLKQATEAGRFNVTDPDLTWRMACHAILGVALNVTQGRLPADCAQDTVINLLCMTGIGRDEAIDLANRERPPLPH